MGTIALHSTVQTCGGCRDTLPACVAGSFAVRSLEGWQRVGQTQRFAFEPNSVQ